MLPCILPSSVFSERASLHRNRSVQPFCIAPQNKETRSAQCQNIYIHQKNYAPHLRKLNYIRNKALVNILQINIRRCISLSCRRFSKMQCFIQSDCYNSNRWALFLLLRNSSPAPEYCAGFFRCLTFCRTPMDPLPPPLISGTAIL